MFRCLLGVVLVSACGLDRDIEDEISIDQGIYGLLVAGCDTNNCREQPATDEQVIVYAAGEYGVFANGKSNGNGVYELDLPAGDYTLCTYSCTPASVPPSGLVRFDWTSGPGGGEWHRID